MKVTTREFTVHFDYTKYEIPKRCRKPRNVLHKDGEHTVELKLYDDVPVVAVLHDEDGGIKIGRPHAGRVTEMPIVKIGDGLYVPAVFESDRYFIHSKDHPDTIAEVEDLVSCEADWSHWFLDDPSYRELTSTTLDGIREDLDKVAEMYPIVNGRPYRKVLEPHVEYDAMLNKLCLRFDPYYPYADNNYNVNVRPEEVVTERVYGSSERVKTPKPNYDLEIIDPTAFVSDPQEERRRALEFERDERNLAFRLALERLEELGELDSYSGTRFNVRTPNGTEMMVDMRITKGVRYAE